MDDLRVPAWKPPYLDDMMTVWRHGHDWFIDPQPIFRLVYCGPMFLRCLKFPPVLSNGLQRVSQGPLCGDREAAGIVWYENSMIPRAKGSSDLKNPATNNEPVYIYICIHTHIYIHTHTHTHIYIHIYTYTYTYMYICISIYLSIYLSINLSIYQSINLSIFQFYSILILILILFYSILYTDISVIYICNMCIYIHIYKIMACV